MNLLDLQRMGLESGELTEADIDNYTGQNVILNFRTTDIGLRAKYHKLAVYPDLGCSNMTEGTWICTLEKMKDVYRATPVRKLDASFFMELKREQKDEIIEALWDDHRDELLPELREYYSEILKADIEKAVDERTKTLGEEISRLKDEKSELQRTIDANEAIINSMQTIRFDQTGVEDMVPFNDVVSSKLTVRRITADTISCPLFTSHKYFVHVSRNLKKMVIKPHDYGTVVCVNNTLLLSGLGTISTFTGEMEMTAEYIGDGCLTVYL